MKTLVFNYALYSSPVHFIILPFTDILSPVLPLVFPVPLNVILEELSLIDRTVGPLEDTMAMLFALRVFSLVAGPIWPNFLAFAILFIVFPLADIFGSIHVNITPLAVKLKVT